MDMILGLNVNLNIVSLFSVTMLLVYIGIAS